MESEKKNECLHSNALNNATLPPPSTPIMGSHEKGSFSKHTLLLLLKLPTLIKYVKPKKVQMRKLALRQTDGLEMLRTTNSIIPTLPLRVYAFFAALLSLRHTVPVSALIWHLTYLSSGQDVPYSYQCYVYLLHFETEYLALFV